MKHVVDANCWRLYVDEKLESRTGIGSSLFEPTDRSVEILFDDGRLIRQQYIMNKAPFAEQIFDHWFEQFTLRGQVIAISLAGKDNLRTQLLALGIPRGEHVYFRVAVHGRSDYLISLDSDFFDPRKKLAGAKAKEALLKSGKGPVCKHMMKTYKVTVCCPDALMQ